MIKKIGLFLASFILLINFICLVYAQAQGIDSLEENIDKIDSAKDNVDDFKYADSKEDYLKEKWADYLKPKLEKNKAGQILLFIDKILNYLSPAFKVILGFEYQISFAFILACILWLTLFIFILDPMEEILSNTWLGVISSFIIASIAGVGGLYVKASETLAFALSNLWIAFVSIVIAIVIALFMNNFGKIIGKKIKDSKENSKKEQTDQDRKIIHTDAKVAQKELESFSNGSGI
jgi:hypothetical protein